MLVNMLTSIDKEGTKKGFDIELNKKISESVNIPIISSGGAGKIEDIADLIDKTDIDAVGLASLIHYKNETIKSISSFIKERNIQVRL